MRVFFIFLLFSANAFALEAVVTVLEAPMFQERRLDAPVVQYLRKGDVIRVHPSLANSRKYDEMQPNGYVETEEVAANTFYVEDEFIPTIDRQGKQVYVLSDHVYVYFNDAREFTQTIPRKDPTDYRLKEPLTKNYPLYTETGHRGQFLFGFTQPYNESYPYAESVKTKGYMSPIDINITILRKVSYDMKDRFYFGGTFNTRIFENRYTLMDNRSASENGLKFGLGPYISYDAYKGEKDRISVYGSIIFYFFNQLKISQANDQFKEERNYQAYTFSPKLGFQYHRKEIFEHIDFVVGTGLEMETPGTFRAKNAGNQVSWWHDRGNDKFSTRTLFSLSGYLGIQSAY